MMEQGLNITEGELLYKGWVRLLALKGGQVWEKNGRYILFDSEENIILAT